LQYFAWRLVNVVVGRAPLRVAYAVAWVCGSIGFYAWPRGRRATMSNYRRVLGTDDRRVLRRAGRASLVNYCRYLADFVRLASSSRDEVVRLCDPAGCLAELDGVLARGKGVVIASMHFGNWDLGASATAALGYPAAVVAESSGDPRLDAMVAGSRERMGLTVLPMERLGPSILRTLRRNGLVALLFDRPVQDGGVDVTFFGERCRVPQGAARLALRTGATLVPMAFVRLHPRRPEVRMLADFSLVTERTGDEEADIRRLAQALFTSYERFIVRYPEQWYMFREMWR
jgi:phosphatidylinositol dimannoside acyltransferase